MTYRLVRDLADDGIPVEVICRVLGFSTQGFYMWSAQPVSNRDWDDAHLIDAIIAIHADDPEFGDRFIADELAAAGAPGVGEPGAPAVCAAEDRLEHPAQATRGGMVDGLCVPGGAPS